MCKAWCYPWCAGTDAVYILEGSRARTGTGVASNSRSWLDSVYNLDSASVYTQVLQAAARQDKLNRWNGGTDFGSYFGYTPVQ